MPKLIFREQAILAQAESKIGVALRRSFDTTFGIGIASLIGTILLVIAVSVYPYARRIALQGRIAPEGGIVDVQTPVAGVIAQIFVKEGALVHRGQKLFQVSSTAASINREFASIRVSQSTAERIANMKRELKELRGVQALSGHKAQLLRQDIINEQNLMQEEFALLNRRIAIQSNLSKQMSDAARKGIVSRLVQQQELDALSELNLRNVQLRQRLLASKQRLRQAEISSIDSAHANREARSKLERELRALEEYRLTANAESNFYITATHAGTISHLQLALGKSVAPNQRLCLLAADSATWLATLRVGQEFARLIRVGQPVLISDPTIPLLSRASYLGTVYSVSSVAIPPSKNSGETVSGGAQFVVKVRVTQSNPFAAGVLVDARIEIGKKSLIKWLWPVRLAKENRQ